MRQKLVAVKDKESGFITKFPKAFVHQLPERFVTVSKGKLKSFVNKQNKKDANFQFLKAYIAKGRKIYDAGTHVFTYAGKRNLFGIQLTSE